MNIKLSKDQNLQNSCLLSDILIGDIFILPKDSNNDLYIRINEEISRWGNIFYLSLVTGSRLHSPSKEKVIRVRCELNQI